MNSVIYYDVTRVLSKAAEKTPTGIDRVDIRYAKHFLDHAECQTVFIYTSHSVFKKLDDEMAGTLIDLVFLKWMDGVSLGHKETEWLKKSQTNALKIRNKEKSPSFPRSAKEDKNFKAVDGELLDVLSKNRSQKSCYINTSHYGVGNNSCTQAYYVFKVLGGASIFFYLHDLIPIDFPEYVNEGDDKSHAVRVTAMANYADVVLVNSEYTKDRFLSYCHRRGLRVPETEIALIGVEPRFLETAGRSEPDKSLIKGDYFITVSTIEPRKNHLLLLQIWRELAESGQQDIPRLVIIGKRGWCNETVFSVLDRCPAIQPYVSEMSGLTDLQLISLMKGAKAMLFPSFVEGWGMPVVEAMALNLPIVCSDIPAFVESGQGIAIYKNPLDGDHWKEEIIRMHQEDAYLVECRKRIKNYYFPSWENHFSVVGEALKNITKQPTPPLSNSPIGMFKRALEGEKLPPETDVAPEPLDEFQPWAVWMIHFASLFVKAPKKKEKLFKNPRRFFADAPSPWVRRFWKIILY